MRLTRDGVYRSNTPMTEDQLRMAAPAIFAGGAHESRSDQYSYVPTIDIIRGLEKHTELRVFGATAAKTRDVSKKGHTKHVVRLRTAQHFDAHEAPEIILFNAHDGSSSYRLFSGVYRFACANGMIAGDGFEGARIQHKGDVLNDVIEATYSVVQDFDRITDNVQRFKSIQLSEPEQLAFAEAAHQTRYDDPELAPCEPKQLLKTCRQADVGGNLWLTFNRVQEGIVRGGMGRYVRAEDANGRTTTKYKRARAIRGIDQNTTINRALWTLTERMAELKAA